MKKKLLRFVSLALASFVLGGISTCAFAEESESEIDGSNWMSAIKPEVPITAINMPGTHDSSTKYVDISPIFKTQDGSVSEQLYRGARYFDMRFELQKDKRLVAVHSAASCRKAYGVKAEKLTAADAEMCADFLKKNPGETVLFQLKEGNGKTGTVFFDAFYEQCIKSQEDIWFLENRIPTLGEVRGKIVLLRVVKADRSKFDDQNSGLDFGAYPHVPVKEVINFISGSMKKASTGKTYSHLYVQDSYKLGGSKKWQAVTTFLESELDPENFNICLSSCVGLGLLADNQSQTQKVRLQGRQDIRNNRHGLSPRGRLQEHIHDKFRNNDRDTERRHRIFGANFVHFSRAHVLRSSQSAVRHRPCRELYCELVLPLKFNIDTSRYTAAKACVFCRGIFDRFFICENIK